MVIFPFEGHVEPGFRSSSDFLLESARLSFQLMARGVDSQCQAFQLAIEVLGRPWTALILNVLQAGPLRFSELSEQARGPGDKVLSARLKDLEARGLILRRVDPGPPVRVSYELTEKGRAFGHVAAAIERWGRALTAEAEPRARSAKARRHSA
jgi:DNA-binding HxlR family transcriptional regulator